MGRGRHAAEKGLGTALLSESYIRDLMRINGDVLGEEVEGFRTRPVVCVDKFGREVRFCAPQEIGKHMEEMLRVFCSESGGAAEYFSVSVAFAKFFYTFIAIHPFGNGNRRTAVEFLTRRAREKEYSLRSTELLQRILFEGNVAEELKTLSMLFSRLLQAPCRPRARSKSHSQSRTPSQSRI